MVHTTPQHLSLGQTATVRALSSLTPRDVAAVRATVRATGNRHTVEQHDDYDGYLSLLLTPTHALTGGFLVSGRTGAVDLARLHGDDMEPLGCFPSIGAAMLVLRPALEADGPTPSAAADAERLTSHHGHDADLHAALRADKEGGPRWRAALRAIDGMDQST